MSAAARKAKDPPTFSVSEYVDIDIDPYDLEEAGWVYVGKEQTGPEPETVMDTVRAWHDRDHDGPWRWCQHELCDELRGRSDDA